MHTIRTRIRSRAPRTLRVGKPNPDTLRGPKTTRRGFLSLRPGKPDPFTTVAVISGVVTFIVSFTILQLWIAPGAYFSRPTRQETRMQLADILTEHVTLLAATARSAISEKPDYSAQKKALAGNTGRLAEFIALAYGASHKETFQQLWKNQDDAWLRYATALSGGYRGDAAKELPQLTAFPEKVAAFFVGVNPKTDKQSVKTAVSLYVSLVKTIIDMHIASDYSGSIEKEREAIREMKAMSELLISELAKSQKPMFR